MVFQTPEWHDRLTSTNTVLLHRLSSGETLPTGFVLATREQTAGRGRYARRWVGEPGKNLTFSFHLTTQSTFPKLSSLPMAIALGIVDALATYNITAQVKWPNDVLIDGGKICGMLLERSETPHPDGTAVVVGIGLNVNMEPTEAAHIDRPATSMRIETGQEYPIETTLNRILEALPPWLTRWETNGFSNIRNDWMARCAYVGEQIRVGEGKDIKSGILKDFGEHGQLLLRLDNGQEIEIWAGDVAAI